MIQRPLATNSYSQANFIATQARGWDTTPARLSRYEVFESYYHNIAYDRISSFSEIRKTDNRLYKHVRGVYNPVQRLVELYTAKCYGGLLDTETATMGAIELFGLDDGLRDAIIQLWIASRWGQKKTLLPRNGATNGDAFIKIVDDVENNLVFMENINPAMIKRWRADPTGVITYAEIEYYIENQDDALFSYDRYTEIWTPESVTTKINDKPAAFHYNARGEQVSEWDNEYGFVPIVHAVHRDVGLRSGANAFYTQLHKIDELNDYASVLGDGARRQVHMPVVFFGVRKPTNPLDFGADGSTVSRTNNADTPARDSQGALYITTTDARVETLPPTLSLSDGVLLVDQLIQELERDMPELSMHRIRETTNLTAPGVTAAYQDATARIQEAQGNYNAALTQAHQMGVAIAGMRRIDGFQRFNLVDYTTGNLEHNIRVPPVIDDNLSKTERITFTLQAMQANAPSVVYQEMGWDENDIQDIQAAQQQQSNMFLMTQQTQAPSIAPDETPQEAAQVVQERRVDETTLLNAQDLLQAV